MFKRKKKQQSKWKIVGGVALVALATGLIANAKDIYRYLKISTM